MTTGLYRLLESSHLYEAVQKLLAGGGAARRRFVSEFLQPEPGAAILDIGCGTGSLLDHLPADTHYVGYDINERYLEHAQRRYGDRGTFLLARASAPPSLEPASFDRVVAKGLLHHLADDEAAELVTTAHRSLRPGGMLVTIDPVLHAGQTLVARALIARDRGRGVRTPESYRALVASRFGAVEGHLLTDLLIVPYSHFVLRAVR